MEFNNSECYTTHTSTPFKHDIVNNYFIAGPASSGNFPWYQIDKNQSIYYSGNLYDSDKNGALNGSTTTPYWYQGVGTVLSSPWSAWTSIVPPVSSDLAYRFDVSSAGAFPRDEVDSLVINQIKTLGSGTAGTGTGTVGPDGGLYTSQTQTGLGNNGYGTITGLTAPTDTDGDGMPDFWEQAAGSNPAVANALTNTADGYTLLEHYLNWLAAPHGVTQTNMPVDITLRQFTAGFAASATYSFSKITNCTVTLLNATNAHVVPNADFTGLVNFDCKVLDGIYSNTFTVTVAVTTLTPPDAAAVGYGALIGQTGVTVPVVPPANLTWRGDGSTNAWNTTASNWLNNASPAVFKNTDVVTFDDTGSNSPAIKLSGTLAPGAILFNDEQNYALAGSGVLSGSGTLTKTGSGTLNVGTTNSGFSGSINISGGSVELVSGASIGTGKIALSGGSTFNVLGGGAGSTVSGAIAIPAGDTVTLTSGQLATIFSGNITSGDAKTILNMNGGLSFSGATSSQFDGFTGTVIIQSGTTLRFSAASSGNTLGSLNPGFVVNGTMRPRNAGNTIALGSISGSGQLVGQEKPPDQGGGTGNTTYKIGGNNLDSTFSGALIDSNPTNLTALTKSGTGRLTLAGNNTYSGKTAVGAGTLFINGNNSLSPVTVSNAATLGGVGTIGGLLTVNSGGKLNPGTNVGTLALDGGLTLNGATLNYDFANVTTAGGGVNDLLAMTGGALTLTGTSTVNPNLINAAFANGNYTLISGGASTSGTTANLAWGGPAGCRQTFAFDVGTLGTVLLNVSGTPAASLVWHGTNGVNWDTSTINWANGSIADLFYNLDVVTFDDTGANPSSVTLTTTLWPAAIVVNGSQNYTFGGSGALQGTGTLTKLGSGTLTIGTSNSTYAGAINLYDGTLAAAAGSALGSGAMTISAGATFSLPSGSPSVFFAGPVMIPANQTGTISSGAPGNGLSGNLFSGNSASVLNLAGGVSFSGTTSSQFDGFTGTINVQSGATLRYSSNSSGNTFGSLNPTFVLNGTLQPRNAGNTVVLGTFAGSGTLAGPQSGSGPGDTLYVIGGNNSDSTFSGVISSNTAAASSQVIVNKIGTGTLTLSGASTYAGGTTVNGGTLRVNNTTGSGTGSGDLEISAGSTLAGNGIIGSATTVDDFANFAPGNPSGTLTFSNNLTLNDNSVLRFALGTSSDSVVVTGDLILTGQLQITNAVGFGPGSYPLFTCSGALDLGNLVLAAAPAGYNYSFDTSSPVMVKLVVSLPAPPNFGNINLTGTHLVFSGSNGAPFMNYYVLGATNLMTPLTNWTRIATNQFDANGAFSFTNGVDAGTPQNFYRLQL